MKKSEKSEFTIKTDRLLRKLKKEREKIGDLFMCLITDDSFDFDRFMKHSKTVDMLVNAIIETRQTEDELSEILDKEMKMSPYYHPINN